MLRVMVTVPVLPYPGHSSRSLERVGFHAGLARGQWWRRRRGLEYAGWHGGALCSTPSIRMLFSSSILAIGATVNQA